MTWIDIARREHSRIGSRYPSDLTDGEWALIGPLLPAAKSGGRTWTTDLRDVMNGDPLSGDRWLPVADAAEGHSAAFDGAGLFLWLAQQWPVSGDQSSSGHKRTRAGGQRGFPSGRYHRKTKRQNQGKRWHPGL